MRNVPRPSHGDISCSGSGTRGFEQIFLYDHHIDDDEGVELTKLGVKPSNAIRSNILNPLPDPADHLLINPSADDTRAIRLYEMNTRGSRRFNSTRKYLSLLQSPIVKRSGAANGSAGGNKAAMEKRAAGNGLAGVEVLEKSKKDLEQARNKDKVLFEEAIGKERKLSEENHETFKEEMIKDTNKKLSSSASGSSTAGDKPGVPDVTKDESTESESESWGNDEDDRNDENDLENEGNDERNKSDDDETPFDSERVKDDDEDDDDDDDKFKGDEDRRMNSDDVQDKKADETEVPDANGNQLPQILPKEVSNFAPLVIETMITKSLNHFNLAKASSQPQSTYEAATTLTEFELKKILIDKINSSESYLTASEHRECYDGLIKSYNLDKDFLSSYDVYSLKRSRQDKDKDEGPSAGSDRGLKKRKTSKDVEPTTSLIIKIHHLGLPKATSLNQNPLDNPKGGDYPFDLSKPLPLIARGNHQSVPVEFFINNDLKYLQEGILTMIYTTSTTKTKATQYDLLGIKDMVPNIWSLVKVAWKHVYGYLEEIVVRRADNALYKFKEGDDVANFAIALRMFTRSLATFFAQRHYQEYRHGVLAKEKMEQIGKEKSSFHDQGHQQAAKGKEDDEEFREIYWW
nr:hypothetical protein [Tanacetum cinerariifolium]